jgi:hypothetical protein
VGTPPALPPVWGHLLRPGVHVPVVETAF